MDREALQKWLNTPQKTWRWNHGEKTQYFSIEATPELATLFSWSHEYEKGGKKELAQAKYEDFYGNMNAPFVAPDAAIPAHIIDAVRTWMDENKKN